MYANHHHHFLKQELDFSAYSPNYPCLFGALICLISFGHFNTLQSCLHQTPLGNGEKTPQPSVDDYLFVLPYFFWQADLNTNVEDESRSFYGVSSQYESPENMVITCSTKVCSFGKQVVEKVEVGSRHLGAGFSLGAVLSLQVFVFCIYLKAKYMPCLLSER